MKHSHPPGSVLAALAERSTEVQAPPGWPQPCWQWDGGTDSSGYGWLRHRLLGPRQFRVGRLSWVLHHPDESLAAGWIVRTRCGNRRCWRPEHLQPQRRAEILQEVHDLHGPRTHCVHGHEMTPENTGKHIDARGHTRTRCLTCSAAGTKRYRDRKKAEKFILSQLEGNA